MRPIRPGMLLLLLLGFAFPLTAQFPPPAPPPTRVTFNSSTMGEERSIQIRVPAGYERTSTRYPVLYLTDGDAQLAHTVATIEFLARNARMPEMIVVGISNTDRTRDLTPTNGPLGEPPNAQTFPTAGGADRFLTFIEREVIPHVEKNYRTLPFRVFAGHSFGGLFAIHSLYAKPDLFQARIAVSPTFTWDNNLLARRFDEFARTHAGTKSTLYFSVGNEGEASDRGYEEFKKLLAKKAPKNLTWDSVRLGDEDHGSVVMLTHYHGLRTIFQGWQYPGLQQNALPQLSDIEGHYEKLSSRLGFRVLPPENLVNVIGYRLLNAGENERAIAVFKRNVELYPESANVHDSLGEAYEKSGKMELAAPEYARAAEMGKSSGDANTRIFEENLARANRALGR